MISMTKKNLVRRSGRISGSRLLTGVFICLTLFSSCGVYTFHDVSYPANVKTVRVNYLENRSRGYINPQLSPRLTDALKQKITNETRLTVNNSDNADYQISGWVSNYSVSTSAISSNNGTSQSATNRLTVGMHIVFLDYLNSKTQEFDISRDFDFAASLTLTQAEAQLNDEIIKNVTDEIFNHIFSNW